MAQPDSFVGARVLIQIGDGASPETFAHPCLINAARNIEMTVATVESVIPDCANQEAPAWVQHDKNSLSVSITGEGVMDAAAAEEYVNWFKSPDPKNVRAVINNGGTGQTLTGQFHLTSLSVGGPREERVTASLTLQSTGIIANAANA